MCADPYVCLRAAGSANPWPADKDQCTHTQGQAKDCGRQEEVNVDAAAAAAVMFVL